MSEPIRPLEPMPVEPEEAETLKPYPVAVPGPERPGKVVEWRQAAADKAAELREAANEKAEKMANRASDLYERFRDRSRSYAHEYPLRTIAIAAGAGFLLGAVLRIWRSRGYE